MHGRKSSYLKLDWTNPEGADVGRLQAVQRDNSLTDEPVIVVCLSDRPTLNRRYSGDN
ncbi:hypothetical protein [Ottowia thiooxydans]|uniref:Uncharacterized protein n=1 Tax=Ottowia thiooxydans TaxID=219182 RepID=A0ABV2Q5G1_9BURK